MMIVLKIIILYLNFGGVEQFKDAIVKKILKLQRVNAIFFKINVVELIS
jgi:hypothetical protein